MPRKPEQFYGKANLADESISQREGTSDDVRREDLRKNRMHNYGAGTQLDNDKLDVTYDDRKLARKATTETRGMDGKWATQPGGGVEPEGEFDRILDEIGEQKAVGTYDQDEVVGKAT